VSAPVVVPLALARLRRCNAEGDVRGVLTAAEALVGGPWHDEAAQSFYGVFWLAAEDEALHEQVGALDLRIAGGGA
jgi:hypothetical protein